jgi:hypothetical protein
MTPPPCLDVRADFPFLSRLVNGRPIAYLDNAATSQKQRAVLDLQSIYSSGVSNVHRAVSFLADEVTPSARARIDPPLLSKKGSEREFVGGLYLREFRRFYGLLDSRCSPLAWAAASPDPRKANATPMRLCSILSDVAGLYPSQIRMYP